MKTSNYLVMAAALAAFSACSNNDETSIQKEEATVLSEMTIRLAAPATYADFAPSEGFESKMTSTLVFVKTTGEDGKSAAAYKMVTISGAQTTVKFPVNASTVYVLSNLSTEAVTKVETLSKNPNFSETDLEGYVQDITKKYVGELNSKTGSFIMSGKAVINASSGVTPYILSVTMSRDVSKVSFTVNKVSVTVDKDGKVTPDDKNLLKSVASISVQRSTPKVAPFKMDGSNNISGYELLGTKVDGYIADVFTSNTAISEGATDFTFSYNPVMADAGDTYVFNPIYVLPNYATRATNGTVIVLKANVMVGEVEVERYYRARISSDLLSYTTAKNTYYQITASITGPGAVTPIIPEDEKDQLIVSVTVANWGLVLSNQVLN